MLKKADNWTDLYHAAEAGELDPLEAMVVQLIWSFLGSETRSARWGWVGGHAKAGKSGAKSKAKSKKPAAKPRESRYSDPAPLDIMPFGKHKGKRIEDIDEAYLQWVLDETNLDRWPGLREEIEDWLGDASTGMVDDDAPF